MGGVQKRKRNHKNIRDTYRKYRLKRRTKDIDQIHEDLKPENADKLKAQPIDPDLPGLGQHYCVHCAKYFVTASMLEEHIKSKIHKRRLKQLKDAPYTQEDAERAAGMGGTDRGVVTRRQEAAGLLDS